MTIAPEGRLLVGGITAVSALATILGGWASLPLWIVAIFAAQFFREPTRHITANDDDILAPADGRVVFVGPAPSPFDGAMMLKISVFMNVFNVHANRVPTAGKVLRSEHIQGAFFNATLDKSSEKNERHLLEIDGMCGRVVCVQVAGLLARRVLCYAKEGDHLRVGERYGFIRFGSRADLYLPMGISPLVALGDRVVAGITRLAVPAA